MQKNKPASAWPLSVLVVVVSVLSILVLYQKVLAIWVEPNYQPADTNLTNNFVFTPLAEDLNLGSYGIVDTGGINLKNNTTVTGNLNVLGAGAGNGDFSGDLRVRGDLTVDGTINGSGGGPGTSYWDASGNDISNNNTGNVLINNQLCFGTDCRNSWPSSVSTYWTQTGNDIYYNSGKVGIGTASPNRNLHVYDTAQNAELDIQSVSGSGNHWAMYHDSASNDLRFWKGGADRITFADTGEIGINTAPSTINMLTISGGARNGIYSSINGNNIAAIYGYNNYNLGAPGNNAVAVKAEANNTYFTGGIGLLASGNYGVKAQGAQYGIWASASIGESIYAEGHSGGPQPLHVKDNGAAGAALFEGVVDVNGLLRVTGNVQIAGANNYLYITNGSGAPGVACSIGGTGRVYLDYTNFRLYICTTVSGGWKYVPLQ